ncbi:hypothetical protein G5V65_11345 [Rhodobacter sp. HX-7-19]|uniref:Uncharacterized protein n=1 Tax=Paragemmobacter kunshanensis TaxID=2583234 RepID=A0A6M1TZ32_9RHOB|nr:hypothetical protein [Rhodobacter kunshanensis]NGQ91492.1 hypothetical protein [Rhodobacter kunshanensis]
MSERTAYYTLHQGRYNLGSNEQQWRLGLYTPFGNVSEIFDEEPRFCDSVEDVLCAIEERVKSWWISTSREKNLATIATIRANLPECELLYAQRRLVVLRAQAERLGADIALAEKLIAALQSEIADAMLEARE